MRIAKTWKVASQLTAAWMCLFGVVDAFAAESISIWPDGSAELEGVKPEHAPKMFLYPGPNSDQPKPAVLILPAGGYKHHSNMTSYVRFLNELGFAVYEVKYRLPVHGYKHPAPLNDAQRSMRLIRQNAKEWGIDPNRVGVLGVSSGGHLTSTLITHFDRGDEQAENPLNRVSCRPDFALMIDSVVTMQGKFCHTPSRTRLLPQDPPEELVDDLSNELQVTADTPPTFLLHGGQDKLVPAENSLLFFIALRKNSVAFSELHFYSHGGHFYQEMDFKTPAKAWFERLGVIGNLHRNEKLQKSYTEPGAWANDNK
jgi:acetyl esterase/lipase